MVRRRAVDTKHNAYASVLMRDAAGSRRPDDSANLGAERALGACKSPKLASPEPVQRVAATLLFADVSGYTALTERLAVLGRAGAEIVTDTINACFTKLIAAAAEYGGDVLRFGGDALFIAFTGDDRVARGISAAQAMQRAIALLPAVKVPGGKVRLRQSIGLHDGELVLARWEGSWIEVMPVGPAVTAVLACESTANAGQIAVSKKLARRLPKTAIRRRADGVPLLNRNYRSGAVAGVSPKRRPGLVEGRELLPVALREALDGGVGSEHRPACIGFVAIKGLDELTKNPKLLMRRLNAIMNAADLAAKELGVTPLATDVSPDGLKLILAAGVPTASEDDAPRIIEATKRICKAAPKHAAAGIHLGIVFAGDVGHPKRRSYTVMGDAVNLAARLAYKADLGKVLASETLVQSARRGYSVTWLAPFRVKGKEASQVAALIGASRRATATNRASSFALRGRAREVREAIRVLSTTACVEIVGPAGVGTTAVAQRLLASAQPFAMCTATIAAQSRPLGLVRMMVELIGGSDAWTPIALRVFSEQAPNDDVRIALAIADEVIAMWPAGLLLVVDHTQHLDEASTRVMRALVVGIRQQPTERRRLVLLGRAPIAEGLRSHVEVGPLPPGDIRSIVIDRITAPLSDAEVAAIVHAADGSPGLAVALAAIEPGAELPPSHEALIAARIDRLSPADRLVVRELATMGANGSLALAAEILALRLADLKAGIARSSELVKASGNAFDFVDEVSASVAAKGLPVVRARTIHARLLRIGSRDNSLSAAQLKNHAIRSGNHSAVLRWSIAAADRAAGSGATTEAADHLSDAVHSAQRLRRSGGFVVAQAERWATAAERAGKPADVERALRVAIGHCRSGAGRAYLQIRLAAAARRSGDLRRATRILGIARTNISPRQHHHRCVADIELAWIMAYGGKADAAIALAIDVLASTQSASSPQIEFAAATLVEQVRSAEGLPGGRAAGRRALAAAQAAGDQRLIGMAVGNLALIDDNRGRWRSAERSYLRAERALRRVGDLRNSLAAQVNRASILLEVGAVEEASTTLQNAIRAFAAAGDSSSAAAATSLWVRANVRLGTCTNVRQTEQRMTAALAEIRLSADIETVAFHEAGWVEALLILGERRKARRMLAPVLTVVGQFESRHLLHAICRRLICVLHGCKDRLADALSLACRHAIVSEWAALETISLGLRGLPAPAELLQAEQLLGIVSRPIYRTLG
jgi:class 3 adenylate cyclase/tetratricopeptide (TPR) repeat protein